MKCKRSVKEEFHLNGSSIGFCEEIRKLKMTYNLATTCWRVMGLMVKKQPRGSN